MPTAAAATLDDPAEIAALAVDFLHSLDNLPQEVAHRVREIQHKDAKLHGACGVAVQPVPLSRGGQRLTRLASTAELLGKLAARETALRELLARPAGGSAAASAAPVLSEADRIKADKLADKIRADYRRADEWSAAKEEAAVGLWRAVHAHHKRLQGEIDKISPALIASVASSMPAGSSASSDLLGVGGVLTPGVAPVLSGLSTSLADIAAAALSASASRHSSPFAPPGKKEMPPLVRGSSSLAAAARAGTPSTPTGASRKQQRPNATAATAPGTSGAAVRNEGDVRVEEEEEAEKDETIYCSCQRVSFGEVCTCFPPSLSAPLLR
jgi:chromatin modification-related protein YNG2